MPMTIIRGSRVSGGATIKQGPTFTGEVYADPILFKAEEGININHVTFTPCSRTYWHSHEHGQLLEVKIGSGWICDKGGEPQRLNVGDIVWAPAGTTHWHGADNGSLMAHLAVSHGKTTWLDPVTDEEYNAKNATKV